MLSYSKRKSRNVKFLLPWRKNDVRSNNELTTRIANTSMFQKYRFEVIHLFDIFWFCYILMRHKFAIIIQNTDTTWKVSQYGVFSGLYFPAFGLNTDRHSVSFRIQSEYGKIRTTKTPYLDYFHAVWI